MGALTSRQVHCSSKRRDEMQTQYGAKRGNRDLNRDLSRSEMSHVRLRYNVEDQDEKHRVFLRCSGMHTQAVLDIVKEVCVYHRFRNPLSSIGFVIPAFTNGIPKQLENIMVMTSEVMVTAILWLTVFASAYFGGFAPPSSKYDDLRSEFLLGYFSGMIAIGICISTSAWLRLSAASMARESDMLVFIRKVGPILWLNVVMAFVIFLSCSFCMGTARKSVLRGDHCLDGSMAFTEWWYEWVFDDYPYGQGVNYAKDVPIKNPWSLKAAELGLRAPSNSTKCTSPGKVYDCWAGTLEPFTCADGYHVKKTGKTGNKTWETLELGEKRNKIWEEYTCCSAPEAVGCDVDKCTSPGESLIAYNFPRVNKVYDCWAGDFIQPHTCEC